MPRSRMPRTRSQMARRACGSSPVVNSSRNTSFRIVDQRKRNEQSLLLAAREGHEPGIPLIDKAKLFEQPFAVYRILLVKGSPEVDRLPHFDPLLQLRLLQLNSNPLLQLVNVVKGIKTQHRDGAPVGRAQTLDALHGRGLSRAVRPDQTKDLTVVNLKRYLVDRHGRAVGFPDCGNLNDWAHDRLQEILDLLNLNDGLYLGT